MVESSDVSIVVDAQDCPPLPGLYGINEMDPPLCGAAVISHNEVSASDQHITARRRVP